MLIEFVNTNQTYVITYTGVFANGTDSEPSALFLNADHAAHYMVGHYGKQAVDAGLPALKPVATTVTSINSWGAVTGDATLEVDIRPSAN